nr:hypothetical protein [Tanacetum cinerariifolium]
RKAPTLYDGLVKTHVALSIPDTEETLELAEESSSALAMLKHENDRLIELLISQDLVHIGVNSLAAINDDTSMEQSYVNEYEENSKIQTELAKKNDMIDKAVYNEISNRCSRLKN